MPLQRETLYAMLDYKVFILQGISLELKYEDNTRVPSFLKILFSPERGK